MITIRRRDFIAGAAGAMAWPLAARAQQGGVRRVGILVPNSRTVGGANVDAFKRSLAELGWAEGRNIRFVERYATDNNEIAVDAAELARLAPDVIFVTGSQVLQPMRRASEDIPLVFAVVPDPVGLGFVNSLAHPGGNITGFASVEFGIATKQLDLLKKLAPTLQRVGYLDDPDLPSSVRLWAEIETAAPSLSLQASMLPVRNAEEIERAIMALAREPNNGLYVGSGNATTRNSEMIAMLALRHRLPSMYNLRGATAGFVDGGLAAYAPVPVDLFRRAASYVDRILRGQKPGDLPVQLPTKFEFVLNLKTAKAMGLDIPVNMLALADEIIE